MAAEDKDKLNRVEELKNKLFSRNYQTKAEHRDSFSHPESEAVPNSWAATEKVADAADKFFMKTTVFKNFFIFAVGFLALTLLYAAYVFFVSGNTVSNNNIDISVLGNNFTRGGEELSLIVGITNRNNSPLDLVDLIVDYPKNPAALPTDAASGVEHFRESLGTIPSGAVRNDNLKLVLFGEQGSVIPVKISIEYRVEGSNAIFMKETTHEVTINSTPLNLSVDAPDTVSPNQDITLDIKASLNAIKPVSNMLLKVDYPAGFQFSSAAPMPSLGNNVWDLGDLAPGAEHKISVTGKMLDVFDGEEKVFRVSSGSQAATSKSTIAVVFNSLSHVVTVQKPFIGTQLFVNGVYEKEYAVDANGKIRGEIHWTNNLDTKLDDLEIKAKILGSAVNKKTIDAQEGFYDSASDTITWDRNSQRDFREINPGDSGIVVFSVSPLALFGAGTGLISNPVINVQISISGKQSLAGYSTEELKNSESSTIKIISDVGLSTKALYYSGPFANTGPIPPKAEQPTTYTVTWTLSNTSNSISKAAVRSSLPTWMSFVGKISPSEEDLSYNASTREVVWNVGRIPKGTSITEAAKSVSFQLSFKPSLSQVGSSPIIINDALLTAHDDFANVEVKVTKGSLRTTLESDPSLPAGGGIVTGK